jgi:hypothetical protein
MNDATDGFDFINFGASAINSSTVESNISKLARLLDAAMEELEEAEDEAEEVADLDNVDMDGDGDILVDDAFRDVDEDVVMLASTDAFEVPWLVP